MNGFNQEIIAKLMEKESQNATETVKLGEINGRNINIEVKKTLSMEEFYAVCAALSAPPFVKFDDVDTYVPSGEVTGFKVALIRAYVPDFELPDDSIEAYRICANLNLFQKVHNVLKDSDMFTDLLIIAERYSEYHRLMNTGLCAIGNMLDKANISESLEKMLAGFSEKVQDTMPLKTMDIESGFKSDR